MLRFGIKNADGEEKFVNAGLAIHGSSRSGGYLALEVDGIAVCFISPKGELIVNLPVGVTENFFGEKIKVKKMNDILTQIENLMAFTKGAQVAIGKDIPAYGLHNPGNAVLSFILKDLQGIYESVGNKINGDN